MARDNPFDERHQRARALTREAKKNLLAAYWSDRRSSRRVWAADRLDEITTSRRWSSTSARSCH